MNQFFTVKLDNGSSVDIKASEDLGLKVHDMCVFRREPYTDMGEIVCVLKRVATDEGLPNQPTALRKADTEDLSVANNNDMRARSALRTALGLVDSLGLSMKLINAHYTLDGKQVSIQFSADGRVDFRELVKELSHALGSRIELRQIGVRDETSIYGGIAVCGRPLCCQSFLKEFNSINVKMAKEQDLSLTPATISGVCGRLKCCLKYEYDGYREMEKSMPRRGEWCESPQGRGRVCDRNLLTQRVAIQLEGGNVVWFDRSEITYYTGVHMPRGNSFKSETTDGMNCTCNEHGKNDDGNYGDDSSQSIRDDLGEGGLEAFRRSGEVEDTTTSRDGIPAGVSTSEPRDNADRGVTGKRK